MEGEFACLLPSKSEGLSTSQSAGLASSVGSISMSSLHFAGGMTSHYIQLASSFSMVEMSPLPTRFRPLSRLATDLHTLQVYIHLLRLDIS